MESSYSMRVPPCEWRVNGQFRNRKVLKNLDVCLGLIGDFHQELGVGINHMLEDTLVDSVKMKIVKLRHLTRNEN
jgi:hypothetical protein